MDPTVHDDRLMVEARLARVVREKIRPAVRPSRSPLRVEAWEAPGEPVAVGDALVGEYVPFKVGSMWGKPWGTTWFSMTGDVPADWRGRRVEAAINLGFSNAPGFQSEGMLWVEIDGAWIPQRGLHPFNHDVAVVDPALGGEKVSFLVEAASNPMLASHRPDSNSDIESAGQSPIYVLSKAELVVVDVEVYELREDIRCLSELMAQLGLDDPRRHEILRALERMLDSLVLDDIAATASGARGHLVEVLSRPANASAHRLSAIGHAHIDSAWLWPIRETKRKCARTFSNVLSLMTDYPELKFGCSQAAQYEWMKDEYPSVFAGITDRVAEGRWLPTGGMWVEPDVNLPSGESLVRQFTFGQRFFEEHFGVRSSEVWIPDVFGYTAALPQIMRLAGIDRFLTQKLSWNKTNRFPHHTFWWEGIDGSSVFTHFPPIDSYGALFAPAQLKHAERNFAERGRATRSLVPFGFGDGGGGPNRQMMQQFRRVRDLEGLPKVEIESASDFFDKAMLEYPDAPRWVGELYFETHRGTYTSQAKTKQGNRRCELLLREAELWCVTAYGTTTASGYPKDQLDRIWKTVLLHQFHDILPGSSIGWVHREAEETYAALIDELESIIKLALGAIPATGLVGGLLVANAASRDRDEVAIAEGSVIDESNESAVHAQRLEDGTVAVRVTADGMALGSAASVVGGDRVTVTPADANGIVIANDRLVVELDECGLLTSCVATGAGRDAIVSGLRGNLLQLHPDFPTEYDAWDLDESYRRQRVDIDGVDSIEIVDSGPLVARVRVSRSFRSSKIVQVYELRAGSPRLDIHTEIDWNERDQVLKAAFPLDVQADHLTREIQFGHISSAFHTNTSWDAARFEVCAHRWVDVSDFGFGVALLNNAKYGHDATRTRTLDDRPASTVRITLLKGSQYPDPHADEGHHRFTYSLMPHRGDFREAGVIEEGYALNLPLRVWRHDSAQPHSQIQAQTPIVSSGFGGVVVEAVKPADDDSGDLIVRLYEEWGTRTPLVLRFSFAPSAVTVVDLLEEQNENIPTVAIDILGATVLGDLHPFQIITLRVTR